MGNTEGLFLDSRQVQITNSGQTGNTLNTRILPNMTERRSLEFVCTHAHLDINQEQNTGFSAEEHSYHFIEQVLQVLH